MADGEAEATPPGEDFIMCECVSVCVGGACFLGAVKQGVMLIGLRLLKDDSRCGG